MYITAIDQDELLLLGNQLLSSLIVQGEAIECIGIRLVPAFEKEDFVLGQSSREICIDVDEVMKYGEGWKRCFLQKLIHEAAHAEDPFLKKQVQMPDSFSLSSYIEREAYAYVRGTLMVTHLDKSFLKWAKIRRITLIESFKVESELSMFHFLKNRTTDQMISENGYIKTLDALKKEYYEYIAKFEETLCP